MVGIGGGMFLSPLLFFLRWDKAKRVFAATGRACISWPIQVAGVWQVELVSGVSNFDALRLFILIAAVTLGGQIGARSSLRWFSPLWVRRYHSTAGMLGRFGSTVEISVNIQQS
jgi:uncharacterized membrane protein YfcA